jgi:hypothetical protein
MTDETTDASREAAARFVFTRVVNWMTGVVSVDDARMVESTCGPEVVVEVVAGLRPTETATATAIAAATRIDTEHVRRGCVLHAEESVILGPVFVLSVVVAVFVSSAALVSALLSAVPLSIIGLTPTKSPTEVEKEPVTSTAAGAKEAFLDPPAGVPAMLGMASTVEAMETWKGRTSEGCEKRRREYACGRRRPTESVARRRT